MNKATGVVERVAQNSANFYNAKVDGEWYGTSSKNAPEFQEGDTISFAYNMNGRFKNMDPDTITVKASAGPSNADSSGGNTEAPKANTYQDRQAAISFQSARNAAIETVDLMLRHEAVKLPTKVADRYDGVLSFIDELTARYYSDTENYEAFLENFPSE